MTLLSPQQQTLLKNTAVSLTPPVADTAVSMTRCAIMKALY
jgi:hypothetical protein